MLEDEEKRREESSMSSPSPVYGAASCTHGHVDAVESKAMSEMWQMRKLEIHQDERAKGRRQGRRIALGLTNEVKKHSLHNLTEAYQ